MAVIKLRRIQAERVAQTITAGELAVAGTRLYYGAADTGVNATGLTPTQVAGTNIANLFNQTNTFKPTADGIAGVIFQDAAGTSFYRSLAGRLQTASTFAFNDNDLINKRYVDERVQGLKTLAAVRAATTENLSTFPPTALTQIDGINVTVGDRVLVKNQTNTTQNGIWVVAEPSWVRATDADTTAELLNGYVFVEEGTTQEDTGWTCSISADGTVGSTAISWTQFSGAGNYIADEISLTKIGNRFEAKLVPVNKGGTGQTTYTNGQLLIGNTSGNTLTKATLTGTTNRIIITNGAGSITINADATSSNTANKIVARDGSGNFSAGIITASLDGNAATVTNGVYTVGDQSIGGAKTFTNDVTIDTTSGNFVEASKSLIFKYNQGSVGGGIAEKALYVDSSGTLKLDGTIISLAGHTHTFASLTSTPTTLSGYGITNAMSTSHPANAITGTDISNWNGKQSAITGAATTITSSNLTANRALLSDGNGKVAVSAVTSTELGYLSGLTSAAQTQLNGKVGKTGDETVSGLKTFTNDVTIDTTSGGMLASSKSLIFKYNQGSVGGGISEKALYVDSSGILRLGGTEVSLYGHTHSLSISGSSNILAASGGANSVTFNVETARTAGKFYRNATNPTADTGTETNPVKYEGWFYATRFEGLIDGGTSW